MYRFFFAFAMLSPRGVTRSMKVMSAGGIVVVWVWDIVSDVFVYCNNCCFLSQLQAFGWPSLLNLES